MGAAAPLSFPPPVAPAVAGGRRESPHPPMAVASSSKRPSPCRSTDRPNALPCVGGEPRGCASGTPTLSATGWAGCSHPAAPAPPCAHGRHPSCVPHGSPGSSALRPTARMPHNAAPAASRTRRGTASPPLGPRLLRRPLAGCAAPTGAVGAEMATTPQAPPAGSSSARTHLAILPLAAPSAAFIAPSSVLPAGASETT